MQFMKTKTSKPQFFHRVASVGVAALSLGIPVFSWAADTVAAEEKAPVAQTPSPAEATPPATVPDGSVSAENPAAKKDAPPANQEPVVMRDPFSNAGALAYAGGRTGGGLGSIPVYGSHLPDGIRVRGTLLLAGSEPIAVLEIPGYESFFHLQAGDQFSLDKSATVRVARRSTPAKGKGAASAAAIPPTASEWNSPLIFTVEKVSRNTVTVSQSRKPDEFIIIR